TVTYLFMGLSVFLRIMALWRENFRYFPVKLPIGLSLKGTLGWPLHEKNPRRMVHRRPLRDAKPGCRSSTGGFGIDQRYGRRSVGRRHRRLDGQRPTKGNRHLARRRDANRWNVSA